MRVKSFAELVLLVKYSMTFSIHTTLCLNKTNPFLVKDEEVFNRSFPSITFDQNIIIAIKLQNIAITQNLFIAANKLQNITFNERERDRMAYMNQIAGRQREQPHSSQP